MAFRVRPTHGGLASSRNVPRGRRTSGAVNAGSAAVLFLAVGPAEHGRVPAHPGPLVRRRVELPQLVQVALILIGVESPAAKQPQVAVLIGPSCRLPTRSPNVPGGRSAQGAVNAGLDPRVAEGAAAVHPRPFACRGIKLPKIVGHTIQTVGVVAPSPKNPPVPPLVAPTRCQEKASGVIGGRGRSQRSIHSGWARVVSGQRVAPTHPSPLVDRRVEDPHVVENAPLSDGVEA